MATGGLGNSRASSNAARRLPELAVCDKMQYGYFPPRPTSGGYKAGFFFHNVKRPWIFVHMIINAVVCGEPAVNRQRWSGKLNVNVESEFGLGVPNRTLPRNCVAHRKPWRMAWHFVILRTLVLGFWRGILKVWRNGVSFRRPLRGILKALAHLRREVYTDSTLNFVVSCGHVLRCCWPPPP